MKKLLYAFFAIAALGMVVTTTSCSDPCKDVTCVTGTCEDQDGEGVCNCDAGYEGTDCGTEERAKFVGSYSGSDACSNSGASASYTSTIANSSTSVSSVLVTGLWDGFFINTITGTVSGSTITVANQEPDNDGFTVEGSGTYDNGVISWTFTVVNTANSEVDNCTMTATKQ